MITPRSSPAKKVYASASEIIHHLWALFNGDCLHIASAAIQPAHQVANAEFTGVDPLAVNREGMLRRGVDAFALDHQRDDAIDAPGGMGVGLAWRTGLGGVNGGGAADQSNQQPTSP